jgi:glycerol uptake facilitator-like aquaporin
MSSQPLDVENTKNWYENDPVEMVFGKGKVDKKAFCAEFVGLFLFQFLGACAASNAVDSGLSTAALGNGAALVMVIYSTLHISGAHLNPAVSTALLLIGEDNMTVPKYLSYILAQYSGATGGALVLKFLCPDTAVSRNPFVTQGILSEGVSRNLAALGVFEFILTFTLVFVICSVFLDAKG